MKKLKKSKNKLLFGVCSGIAEYFNIDANIVRLIFIIIGICSSGVGLLIYIAASVLMPVDDNIDFENLKSANVDDFDSSKKSSDESDKKSNQPKDDGAKGHSDEEFDNYFKK